jgi:hypothetical protein
MPSRRNAPSRGRSYIVPTLLLVSLLLTAGVAGGAPGKANENGSGNCNGKAPKKQNCAPSITLVAPAAGTTVLGFVDVQTDVNAAVVAVTVSVDGTIIGEDTAAPFTARWDSTKAANGAHTVTAIARSAAGESASATSAVTVSNPLPDTTSPSVSFISPDSGSTISGSVNVAAGASDNVAVAGVQFKVDGVALGAEDTTAPYGVTWSSTATPNGTRTLTAVVRDVAGNTSAAQRTVTVSNAFADSTAPSVSFTSPASGATVSGQVSVAAGASDNVGVAGVQFKLDGVPLGPEDTAAPYAVSWSSTTAANGTHTLAAVARDSAGNATTIERSVTVLNTTTSSAAPLRWSAPALTAPATILIPERGGDILQLAAGKDYILKFQTGKRFGPLRVWGGNNVVLVGGEHIIDDTTSTDYRARRLFEFRDQTGTIHIEGYHGHGPGATEGFNLWTPNAIFQLQNSRVEIRRITADANPQHPDVIQTWSGPKELRVYNFTSLSDYQGFLLMKDTGGVYPGKVFLDRVNFRCLPNPAWGGKCWGTNHLWLLSKLTEVRLGDVWAETGWWNGTLHKGLKASLGYREPNVTATLWAWQEFRADGSAYGPEVVGQPANYGESYANKQGDSLVFTRPADDNIWNFDRTKPGRIYQGIPPSNDFAPTASIGLAYR